MSSASLAHQDAGRVGENNKNSELRFRLKEATAAAHRRLDDRVSGLDLQKFDDYRRYLAASAAALLPLEAALRGAGVAQVFPDWEDRSRTAAIRHDLALLGATLPPLPPSPRLSRANIFGVMYVLEGSRLGAKFLLRTVETSPDPRVATATAYLAHGAGRPLWPGFVARLRSAALTADDEAEVFDGARLAFDLFTKTLDRA
jgi:heme oxygenase